MIKSNKSICAAYKSTVQTEQAMNFIQVRGAGPFFGSRIITIPVGQ